MESANENNFYRLIAVLADVSPDVVRKYLKNNILDKNKQTFDDYLNKNKHILFHLCFDRLCCKCSRYQKPNKCLSISQFFLIFHNNGKQLHTNVKECLCRYQPLKNDLLGKIDITLAFIIITKCEKNLDYSISQWLEQIRDVRNTIFHTMGTKSISDKEFENHWYNLHGCITGLAQKVSKNFAKQIKKRMKNIKERQIYSDFPDILILHEEYVRDQKCYIEKLKLEYIKRFDQTEQEFLDQLEEPVEARCGEVLYQLRYDKTSQSFAFNKGDNTCADKGHSGKVHDERQTQSDNKCKTMVPVLLCLEIPNVWDEKQMNTALQQLQTLFNTNDGNLKINTFSTDEMKILLKIASHLLNKLKDFEAAIINLMTQIIEISGVDTSKQQTIKANVRVLSKEVVVEPALCAKERDSDVTNSVDIPTLLTYEQKEILTDTVTKLGIATRELESEILGEVNIPALLACEQKEIPTDTVTKLGIPTIELNGEVTEHDIPTKELESELPGEVINHDLHAKEHYEDQHIAAFKSTFPATDQEEKRICTGEELVIMERRANENNEERSLKRHAMNLERVLDREKRYGYINDPTDEERGQQTEVKDDC